MKDRISLAVFWAAVGLVAGSLATLQLPRSVVVIVGGIIVLICLAEHFRWLRPRKRALARHTPRSAAKQVKKAKAS